MWKMAASGGLRSLMVHEDKIHLLKQERYVRVVATCKDPSKMSGYSLVSEDYQLCQPLFH
jgi:hypothetical protein